MASDKIEFIEYTRKDGGRNIPDRGGFIKLRPGVRYKVTEDSDPGEGIGITFARALIAEGVCSPWAPAPAPAPQASAPKPESRPSPASDK